jgi:hypothetical protein
MSGFDNMQARMYKKGKGRFVQPDPVMVIGRPQRLNRYSYVNNDPINFIDPSGRNGNPANVCSVPGNVCDSVNINAYRSDPLGPGNINGPDGPGMLLDGDGTGGGGGVELPQWLNATNWAKALLEDFLRDFAPCGTFFDNKGIDLRQLTASTTFIDPNGDNELLNKTLRELGQKTGGDNILNTRLRDWIATGGGEDYGYALVETRTIYFGVDQFKTDPTNQALTVAHEILHIQFQGNHASILSGLGVVDPRTNQPWDAGQEGGAATALDNFLKSGCQKASF